MGNYLCEHCGFASATNARICPGCDAGDPTNALRASWKRVQRWVEIGETVRLELPHSEVCMHMQIAGEVMDVKLLDQHSAQIYTIDGREYSAPITTGEAGFYFEEGRFYCYPEERPIYSTGNIRQFSEAIRSRNTLEIDERLSDYYLGVLPPIHYLYRAKLASGREQEADFGFAEGADQVIAFWHVGARHFAALTKERSRG